jgi:AcrR family transcriptional regulator
VLEAARAGFSSDGPHLSLDEIARRAGVGAGTVHRHFPTKESLLAAVIVERLSAMTNHIRTQLDSPDPVVAFTTAVRELTNEARENMALSAALGEDVGPSAGEAGGRLSATLGELLARAQAAGGIRPDITVHDLHAVLAGAITIERGLSAEHSGMGLDIVLTGLRSSPASGPSV